MSNIGKPAYQGRPDPQHLPDRILLVLIVLLVLGFLRAAIRYDWFGSVIDFILS